jgi:uncharacterized protein (TIGR02453 family)
VPSATKSSRPVVGPSGGSRFRGWPPETVEFFEELELDNTKAFWTARKQVYEDKVLAPMLALLSALESEFGGFRVFRPYRDTRFSADKSRYNTSIAAHNEAGYISLSSEHLGVGSGLHMPSSDQLARFRAAVADDRSGPKLVALVAALEQKRIETGAHEVLKTAPRGYDPNHPRVELLRHKGLTAWRQWEVGPWLGTTTPERRTSDFLSATAGLRKWLADNVGPAEDT